MVWPLFPIVVYEKVTLTAVLCGVFGCINWSCGYSGFWALLAAPIMMGLYLRFHSESEISDLQDLYCSKESYEKKKAHVAATASKIVSGGGKIRMFKKTASNTFRLGQVDSRTSQEGKINLSDFNHLIGPEIVETGGGIGYIDIEASTTFETFVDGLLPLGYMPLVVPELRTITVGGAIVGIGIESSSFKYGFVHEGLLEADILLGNGEVVTISPTQHSDLFSGVPNSLGSFGYLLRLRMQVQKTKPLVQLKKIWYDSPAAFVSALDTASKPEAKNDFVDGMALSTSGGMLLTGKFFSAEDDSQGKNIEISDYSWSSGKQFYKSLVREGVEYLTVKDYIWRWDSDWFWCTQIFPGLSLWLVRYLCGPKLLRSDQYKVFNDKVESVLPKIINGNVELVIQDIEVPVERSAEWIETHCRTVPSDKYGKIKLSRPGISGRPTVPIWLCPVMGTKAPLMPMKADALYINFGFWDALEHKIETKGGNDTGLVNRKLEDACRPANAIKTLYSQCFYSESEFLNIYNGAEYKKLKAKYDPKDVLRGWYQRLCGT